MQRTCFDGSPVSQYSFWLRMVSMQTAVLPVLRSPMMSWRWPRPIGVMASIAFMPVCSGSSTGWRSRTPAAWSSKARSSLDSMGPKPSIGWPRGLITRPRKFSPTGIERTSPVRLTSSPSERVSKLPSTTTPMESVSRFCATPMTPFGNSSSSFVMQPGSPETWAIPSAAEVTTPTSSREASAE